VATESMRLSDDPDSDLRLRSMGPDIFQIVIDGEQRFILEIDDVEYHGQCKYKYPFTLATAAPFNLTIWWPFKNHRAGFEREEFALQYDTAAPVLAGTSQIITPISSTCGPVLALPSRKEWLAPAQADALAALPECSRFASTPGHYLRVHHSEPADSTHQRYLWQPAGCRYANPFLWGAPPEVTQGDFQPRSILFIGDSHVRYAYDILIDAYIGDWQNYRAAPPMKKFEKSDQVGPLRMDFVWEAVLLELKLKIDCSAIAKYDTIVLGAGQHNAVRIPKEAKDHFKQWSLSDWSTLTKNLAAKLAPDACPGQKPPRVIWLGNPARITRVVPATQSEWIDGRSSFRIRLYDSIAWSHFEAIGAMRVDMFAFSQPFVNDFQDTLHMRHTDSLPALIQDLHDRIRPSEPAYTAAT